MLTACWSVKGGSGTTVVTAALLLGAAAAGRHVVGADFGGDLALALGLPEPAGPGVLDWLAAGSDVPKDALGRIAHDTDHGITLIPRGVDAPGVSGADADAGCRLAKAIRSVRAGGPVIADCGRAVSPAAAAFIAAADRSLLVLRPCYLALQRANNAPRPTAVVLVGERRRHLTARDVEAILGVPVAAEIGWDEKIAHAVDQGLLRQPLPRQLVHAMRAVAA
jgi:MinD-like ATPase involved in chromosome partitioning or flagellar assembly